jgi:hypothetical protein
MAYLRLRMFFHPKLLQNNFQAQQKQFNHPRIHILQHLQYKKKIQQLNALFIFIFLL